MVFCSFVGESLLLKDQCYVHCSACHVLQCNAIQCNALHQINQTKLQILPKVPEMSRDVVQLAGSLELWKVNSIGQISTSLSGEV